jgi:hypothetical protein
MLMLMLSSVVPPHLPFTRNFFDTIDTMRTPYLFTYGNHSFSDEVVY